MSFSGESAIVKVTPVTGCFSVESKTMREVNPVLWPQTYLGSTHQKSHTSDRLSSCGEFSVMKVTPMWNCFLFESEAFVTTHVFRETWLSDLITPAIDCLCVQSLQSWKSAWWQIVSLWRVRHCIQSFHFLDHTHTETRVCEVTAVTDCSATRFIVESETFRSVSFPNDARWQKQSSVKV